MCLGLPNGSFDMIMDDLNLKNWTSAIHGVLRCTTFYRRNHVVTIGDILALISTRSKIPKPTN